MRICRLTEQISPFSLVIDFKATVTSHSTPCRKYQCVPERRSRRKVTARSASTKRHVIVGMQRASSDICLCSFFRLVTWTLVQHATSNSVYITLTSLPLRSTSTYGRTAANVLTPSVCPSQSLSLRFNRFSNQLSYNQESSILNVCMQCWQHYFRGIVRCLI